MAHDSGSARRIGTWSMPMRRISLASAWDRPMLRISMASTLCDHEPTQHSLDMIGMLRNQVAGFPNPSSVATADWNLSSHVDE